MRTAVTIIYCFWSFTTLLMAIQTYDMWRSHGWAPWWTLLFSVCFVASLYLVVERFRGMTADVAVHARTGDGRAVLRRLRDRVGGGPVQGPDRRLIMGEEGWWR